MSALLVLPFDTASATKLTKPPDIPKSAIPTIIKTKFKAAEKIPNSGTVNARATRTVYKKPKKADNMLPTNKTYVSFAVELVARPKALL